MEEYMEEYFEQKIYRYNRNVEVEKFIILTNDSKLANSNDSVIVCQPEELEELLELANNLRKHDWTFEMSDDGRYWRWGQEEMRVIRSQIKKCGNSGKKLLDFFYPEDNRGCHYKKDYL